jgi:hypothetical protein
VAVALAEGEAEPDEEGEREEEGEAEPDLEAGGDAEPLEEGVDDTERLGDAEAEEELDALGERVAEFVWLWVGDVDEVTLADVLVDGDGIAEGLTLEDGVGDRLGRAEEVELGEVEDDDDRMAVEDGEPLAMPDEEEEAEAERLGLDDDDPLPFELEEGLADSVGEGDVEELGEIELLAEDV